MALKLNHQSDSGLCTFHFHLSLKKRGLVAYWRMVGRATVLSICLDIMVAAALYRPQDSARYPLRVHR